MAGVLKCIEVEDCRFLCDADYVCRSYCNLLLSFNSAIHRSVLLIQTLFLHSLCG